MKPRRNGVNAGELIVVIVTIATFSFIAKIWFDAVQLRLNDGTPVPWASNLKGTLVAILLYAGFIGVAMVLARRGWI